MVEIAVVNGIVYEVIAEAQLGPLKQADEPKLKRLVSLRRPNGHRVYTAKDYGSHPLYGDNRRYVVIS